MIELDQQGSNKVQITASPMVAPNQCCNCGFSGQQEGRFYIDFGIDIEFYGTVLLCTECFAETAGRIGWITPEINDALQGEIAILHQELNNLRVVEEKYNAIVSATRSISGDNDSSDLAAIGALEIDEVSGFEPRFSDRKPADADSGTSESTVSEGLSDLLSSAESVLDL